MKLSKLQKYTLIIGMIMPFVYVVFFLKYNISEKSLYIIYAEILAILIYIIVLICRMQKNIYKKCLYIFLCLILAFPTYLLMLLIFIAVFVMLFGVQITADVH